jgi:hypothetical protein
VTAAAEAARPARAASVALPGPWLRAGHLLVLSAFAVAQPLFDLLDRGPEFFAVRGSTAADIVLLALLATLAPAVAFFTLELLVTPLGFRAVRIVHLTAVAILVSLVALQLLKHVDAPGRLLVYLAEVWGFAAAIVYLRLRAVRTFLTVLLPAPLVFAVLFVARSPAPHLAFAGTPASAAPAAAHARSTPPIIVVIFDEFPVTSLMNAREKIDARRYPNFARLARGTTWFRNAMSVDDNTAHAVPSLLTGRLPDSSELPLYLDHPNNLFTALPRSYRLHVSEAITRLCPPSRCVQRRESFLPRMHALLWDAGVAYLHVAFPSDVAASLPSITDRWIDFRNRLRSNPRAKKQVNDAVEASFVEAAASNPVPQWNQFVAHVRPARRPALHFIHVESPHMPWRMLPSGDQYEPYLLDPRSGDDNFQAAAYQRHLVQVMFADRLLGRLLDRLERTGLYDRSLLVVTADHGVSFRVGEPRRGARRGNLADIAYVPLFVKRPHQRRGAIVDRNVRTVDVLPTIADAIGTRLPFRVDGVSAFDERSSTRTIDLMNWAGVIVHANVAGLQRDRSATLARKLALFGAGDPAHLYFRRPYGRLIGTTVAPSAPASPNLVAKLDREDATSDDPADVPVLVSGRLHGSAARVGIDLAVAVNGKVVATTGSFDLWDHADFATLVPEKALRRGRNEIAVYRIRGGALELIGRTR